MYKLLLTFRYLRRKLIPWFALAAVVLCTAMVIIVGSVMGGFLDLVRTAGKSVMGDVLVHTGISGFPHYEELTDRIEELPEARAATAVISTFGLLKFPVEQIIQYVQVFGIDGPEYAQITGFEDTLYWNVERANEELGLDIDVNKFNPMRDGLNLQMRPLAGESDPIPGIVPGIEISPYSHRTHDGTYVFSPSILAMELTLTVLPTATGGTPVDPSVQRLAVVNEFHSGFYAVDSRRVYVPFDELQQMMLMQGGQKIARNPDGSIVLDEEGMPRVIGRTPARCTELHVAAAPGITAEALRDAVRVVYDEVAEQYDDMPARAVVITWLEHQRDFIEGVETEKGLLLILFGIISIVAVAMITVIFYMIVLEKTRDIGILRSVGASRSGVASIFLLYGAVIGLIGSLLGTALAWSIVENINAIHAWLGQFGIVIWDRSKYYFEQIPHQTDWSLAWRVALIAVAASVGGALIPAIKASRVDPVESLRYE